tara:strand:- start:5270 stop:5713 length:444 start_codon:yes stop_codon:yes gene_type:complete
VEQEGFYCGDDETNWTQYSPNGCVQNSWINDAWLDCVDGSDEGNNVVPTTIADCQTYIQSCDTVYVEIPVIQIDTIIETVTDTIVEYQDIIITEYVDCDTGLPCNSGMSEAIEKSKNSGLLYNINGQLINEPQGIYIQNGLIKYRLK